MRQCTAPPPGLAGRDPLAGAVVVGGAVRDAHLGVPARDVDWLVRDPAAAARALADATGGALVALDPERGHWRVVWFAGDGEPSAGDDERAAHAAHPDAPGDRAPVTWDLAAPDPPGDPRDPAVVATDLRRRDLTINALAFRPESGEVVDPTGGLADLRRGLVRTVARENLWADPLRAWRVVRFAAQLGFRVERRTRGWVQELARALDATRSRDADAVGGVALPAPERLGAELDDTLATPVAGRAFAALDDLGLLAPVLPELTAGRGVIQGGLHHLDVLRHQLEALQRLADAFPDADLALRWATLLHDVGKPPTRTPGGVTEDGLVLRDRFHGHDAVGAELAVAALRRLRRPRATAARVHDLVAAHMRPLPDDERGARRFAHRLRPLLPDLLRLMLADREAARGRGASAAARRRYRERVGLVLAALEEPAPPAPLVDGRALMAALGIEPGPRVGELLAAIAEARALGDVGTREEALAYARRLQAAH
ncbi:MAG: HD domain-containing protein [Trueperaceae bacterium]|nr:HD domain-containing protein [Trueperaceae bacterium]